MPQYLVKEFNSLRAFENFKAKILPLFLVHTPIRSRSGRLIVYVPFRMHTSCIICSIDCENALLNTCLFF